MLLKNGGEMSISADESRIDDMEYVAERIREADWDKENARVFHVGYLVLRVILTQIKDSQSPSLSPYPSHSFYLYHVQIKRCKLPI
ncbi:MAG: hypothetical protein WCR87_01265 [Saccharofermentanales bacterium]